MERVPPALAPVIYVPGLLYEALLRLRNLLYERSVLRQRRLPGSVISIGNITMGGTGKTPLVIHTAGVLDRIGVKTAVLTRGYGRRDPKQMHIVVPGVKTSSPASSWGDEPTLIRRHGHSIAIGISPNRFAAGNIIWKKQPGVLFLLDDGFQHRKLHRDLDIVVIDGSQPLASNRVFPLGTLREPLSAIRRCDIVVVNDTRQFGTAGPAEDFVRKLHPGILIFQARQQIDYFVPFSSWRVAQSTGICPKIDGGAYLVSALGNPARFRRDVQLTGAEVRGASSFPDHHRLRPTDWHACVASARRAGAGGIVITEKDAIKIDSAPDFPVFVAVQSTVMSDEDGFEQVLRKSIKEWL